MNSQWITTSDGTALHYLESGAGPAVLFIPGWTLPAWIWEPQLTHFRAQYRAVAFDPRSHGESEKPGHGHTPERLAQDIEEVIEQLGLAPVVLVAWAMAVPQVLFYVDRCGTEALRALALVDGFVSWRSPDLGDRLASLKDLQVDRRGETERFVRDLFRRSHSEDYLQRVIAGALQTPTDAAVAMVVSFLASKSPESILARIDKPLLYLATSAKQDQVEVVRAQVPSARVEVLESTGHALFVDEPDAFNHSLEEFMSDCGSGTRQGNVDP